MRTRDRLVHGIVQVISLEKRALLVVKFQKTAIQNALPNFRHEAVKEVDVVLAEKLPTERLLRFCEMVKVGAGMFATGLAIARRVEGLVGKFIHRAAEVQFSL